ncbi:signal peptidase I isoform 1 [Galdieria sulphuraria]|nr:signal peptidase I isoform 1 [Galdieria sulphuraria]EME29925.1 signal peptidase I isoform 1 [Galdieria sulphuraria]|eukprot:XP_005706445.1 signal peptidase I isoform 1 [Galdieria sulphuraria]
MSHRDVNTRPVVEEKKTTETVLSWKKWLLKRESLLQVLNLLLVFASALVIWKGAIAVSLSESPVVVVLSGSMEPGMRRGDLLVLSNRTKQLRCGDIVVYKVQNREIPIVHRIIEVHDDGNEPLYLTKGDNNFFDDRSLYSPNTFFLRRGDIVGKSIFIVRWVGMVTIIMKEHPFLKLIIVGFLSLTVLLGE